MLNGTVNEAKPASRLGECCYRVFTESLMVWSLIMTRMGERSAEVRDSLVFVRQFLLDKTLYSTV